MEVLTGWRGTGYVVTQTIFKDEHPWLPRDFTEGELLEPYVGCTYGSITPAGVAIREPGTDRFLEVPRAAVRIVGVD